MNRAQRRAQERGCPPAPKSWSSIWEQCPFRTIIGGSSAASEMARDIAFTFAALGGEPSPIKPEELAGMVAALRAGRSVLILADREDLRTYHKREILMAAYGAAGSA